MIQEVLTADQDWHIASEDLSFQGVLTADWHIASEDLSLRKELGRGAFGRVVSGQWRNSTVAIKIAHTDGVSNNANAHLWREVGMMMRLHHPNIVQYLGFSVLAATGVDVQPCIVMEYVDGLTLGAYIRKDLPSAALYVSKRTKRRLCLEMTLALEYLHGRRPAFITHRDIKPDNFLLTRALQVKLADFGISRLFDNSAEDPNTSSEMNKCGGAATLTQNLDYTQTSNCGTVRFMAPEVFGTDGMADNHGLMSPDGVKAHRTISVPSSRDTSICDGSGAGACDAKPVARYSAAADIFSLGLVYYFVFEVCVWSRRAAHQRRRRAAPISYLLRTLSRVVFHFPCSACCRDSRAARHPPLTSLRSGKAANRRSAAAPRPAQCVHSFGHVTTSRLPRGHPRPRQLRCGRHSRRTRA